MSDHYYTNRPSSKENRTTVCFDVGSKDYSFFTDSGVFSKEHLDPGSRLLIESIPAFAGKCADIGCGWGPIGIILADRNPESNVTMLDINRRAVCLCNENILLNKITNARVLESDGMNALAEDEKFSLIVTNPPIRAGKTVIYDMFAQAHLRLEEGGALFIVIRKQQGAPSAKNFLKELFGNCEMVSRGGGYWILKSEKFL